MASYRFCRSDDVPLLIQAYNECFSPPEPVEPVDRERFKVWIRTLELWTSSCMVATEGDRLIGVLIAAKRETDSCLLAVGVHPDYRHLEHGRHMVTSLSQKLAILGPPKIRCELPESNTAFAEFLGHCHYKPLATYVDYSFDPPFPESRVPAQMVAQVPLEEVGGYELDHDDAQRPWGRRFRAIERRDKYFQSVRAYALAGADRIGAVLLAEEIPGTVRRVLEVRHAGDARSCALAGGLVRHYASLAETPLLWERVSGAECDLETAQSWGFKAGERTLSFETTALPG